MRLTLALKCAAIALSSISVFSPIASGSATQAADIKATLQILAPYIDNETVVVAHLDLANFSFAPIAGLIPHFVSAPEAAGAAKAVEENDKVLAVLRHENVTDGYFIVSLGGQSMTPKMDVILLPIGQTRDISAIRSTLRLPQQVNLVSADVKSSASGKPGRPELTEAFAALANAPIGIAILPSATSRRVIEEFVPQLPSAVGGGPSTILTRGLTWAAISVDLKPQIAIRLIVKSPDVAAAQSLRAKWLEGLNSLKNDKDFRRQVPGAETLIGQLTPTLSSDRLSITLDQTCHILPLVAASLNRELAAYLRSSSRYDMKQIALAMINFYSTNNHFPAPAIHGPDGKPLLSWRVAVLPFLTDGNLYKQFHLDEPWDSPHNKTLIEKVPAIFRAPHSKAGLGFTNYVVPVGGGAVYSTPTDEPQIKDITDGTSHTIMLVEVDDEHAVIWTKPDDLSFDPKAPAKGIGRLYDTGFNVANCDDYSYFIPPKYDLESLKALFTRAAGDPWHMP